MGPTFPRRDRTHHSCRFDGDGYAEPVESGSEVHTGDLTELLAGQRIPFGGHRWTEVPVALAEAFRPGDRIIIVQTSGDILHVSRAVSQITEQAVASARSGFEGLASVPSERITSFYAEFAARLLDDSVFTRIAEANSADVEDARKRDRSVGRLALDDKTRRSMVDALHMWMNLPDARDMPVNSVDHGDWIVSEKRAPLGVIGFVFEGRPNVFADATGVLRSGNSAVFRIGSDALGTARAMMIHAVEPSLAAAGLPEGSVVLLDSAERSAGHALFSHPGVALAVARGSGSAVAQLGAVARQSGIPVSLHGTGGAWMLVSSSAELARVERCVESSLDRKVCNTLNVVCVPRSRSDILSAVLTGVDAAAVRLSCRAQLHVVGAGAEDFDAVSTLVGSLNIDIRPESDDSVLAAEWEWDAVPELALRFVDDLDEAVAAFNRFSPLFVVSVISSDSSDLDHVYRRADAPFVGNGFTRWVDGQYALNRPELGLSNWQGGRLFARGGILSGDGVFSVRYLATHDRADQRR